MVNTTQRVITPRQHHVINFCKGALKPTPTAILTGAPTVIVPKKPSPIIPYLFQIRYTSPVFGFSSFSFLYLDTNPRILSPKNAAINTPAKPPAMLAIKITHGDNPKA